MRDNYTRLFEPPFLNAGVPNPRHLSTAAYLALARAAAHRGARRNGAGSAELDVAFPGAGFAPTRITVSLRGSGDVRLAAGRPPDRIEVEARATAELIPAGDLGPSGLTDGGGYSGPLAHRQGKPMRPDVALAFDRMAAAARREAGLYLSITSGYRSDAEQAVLWAANPDPKWVAPPGTSLHRYGTELDLGPPAAYAWLAGEQRALRLHRRRYSWEPWHFGYARNTGSASVGYGGSSGDGEQRRALFRPGALPRRDRPGVAALERRRGAAVGPDLRRVELQPVRPVPGRRAGHRPVHAGHGAVDRPRESVRPRAVDRRPGPLDARPAAPVRLRPAGARRLQRRRRSGGAVRRHPPVRGDARLRGEDPRPAGRSGRHDPAHRASR